MLRPATMKKALIVAGVALSLLSLPTCRTTRKTVARLVMPTPTAAEASRDPLRTVPAATPTPTVIPMPVVTPSTPSRYDRQPGVLYEEKGTPTKSSTPAKTTTATRTNTLTTTRTPTEPMTLTKLSAPTKSSTPTDTNTQTRTRTPTESITLTKVSTLTPTRKPGTESEQGMVFRPAVTWTPTPEKPTKRRS